jgi:hypothetical protein
MNGKSVFVLFSMGVLSVATFGTNNAGGASGPEIAEGIGADVIRPLESCGLP